ncbi:hypothetical protein CMV_016468 [Castanea mollissima]|uniref:Uncharacterized protein n=1 Tax=Castanea mollissima TaxID=60419 RepID=A0A8J4R7Y5_9ROSI|nr:hypothetical protein CMV_016468 [Castanea mollissima]
MEDQTEVHDEVVLGDVLQGDNGCQSHEDITFQDICGIKTKPTVGRSKSRLKGVLERPRNPKSQRKKACESRQIQSLRCLNEANSSVDINSLEGHSNVEQVSQLVDNFIQGLPQKEGFGGVVLSGDSVGVGWEWQNEGFDGWNGGEWWMGGIIGDNRQVGGIGGGSIGWG